MATTKMLLVSVVGKKFVKADEVSLDNVRFLDCSFDECTLLYSGGPVVMDNCWLHNCELKIQGSAAIVLESLGRMGFQISPPAEISTPSSIVH
jgi:hypothetical protein